MPAQRATCPRLPESDGRQSGNNMIDETVITCFPLRELSRPVGVCSHMFNGLTCLLGDQPRHLIGPLGDKSHFLLRLDARRGERLQHDTGMWQGVSLSWNTV